MTLGASIGKKELTRTALPEYGARILGGDTNFINSSSSLTVWGAEGTGLIAAGYQPGAPVVDFSIKIVR